MKTNYVLIDLENVIPENLELLEHDWIKVLLFVGKNQTKLPISLVKAVQRLGSRAEYIEMSGTGHNALDFHIAFYIGRIAASEKDVFFHVISNDTGFDPLIAHLKSLHVFADRVTKIEEIPALIQAKVASQSTEERIGFIKDRLLRPNAPRPRSRKTLTSHVSTMFSKTLPDDEISKVIDALFKSGHVREDGKRLVYSDECLDSKAR